MVLAYEAYVIHYASFSQLVTSLSSASGTIANGCSRNKVRMKTVGQIMA